jgi:hypothetical protein
LLLSNSLIVRKKYRKISKMDNPYEDSVTGCFEGGCSSLWRMYVEMTSDSFAEGKNNNNENGRGNNANLAANNDGTHQFNNSVFNVNEQRISRRGRTELVDTQDGVLGCYRTEVSTYYIRNQNFVDLSSIETEERKRDDPIERELHSSIRNYITPSRQRY